MIILYENIYYSFVAGRTNFEIILKEVNFEGDKRIFRNFKVYIFIIKASELGNVTPEIVFLILL